MDRRLALVVGVFFLLFYITNAYAEVLWDYTYNIDWTKYQFAGPSFVIKIYIQADFTDLDPKKFHFYQRDNNGLEHELNYFIWKKLPLKALFYVRPINKSKPIRITYETEESNGYGLEKILNVSSSGLSCGLNCLYIGLIGEGAIIDDEGKVEALVSNIRASTYPNYKKYVLIKVDPFSLGNQATLIDKNIEEINWVRKECNQHQITEEYQYSIFFDVKKEENKILGGSITKYAYRDSSGHKCYYIIYSMGDMPKKGIAVSSKEERDQIYLSLLRRLDRLLDNYELRYLHITYNVDSDVSSWETNGTLTIFDYNTGESRTYLIKRAYTKNDIDENTYAFILFNKNGEPVIIYPLHLVIGNQSFAWNVKTGEGFRLYNPELTYSDVLGIDDYPNNSFFYSASRYSNENGSYTNGVYKIREYTIITGIGRQSTDDILCIYKEGNLILDLDVYHQSNGQCRVAERPSFSIISNDGGSILNFVDLHTTYYNYFTTLIRLFPRTKITENINQAVNINYTKPHYTSELFEINVAPSINLTKIYLYKNDALYRVWTIPAFEEFNYSDYLDIGEYHLVIYSSGTKVAEDYWAVGYPPMATTIISAYPEDGAIIRQESNTIPVDINITFRNTVPTQVVLYEVYPDGSYHLAQDLGCFQSAGEHSISRTLFLPTGVTWKIAFLSDYTGCTFYGTETASLKFATQYGKPFVSQWAKAEGNTEKGLSALEMIIEMIMKIFEIGALWWFIVAYFGAVILSREKNERYLFFTAFYFLGVAMGIVDIWLGIIILLGLLAYGLHAGYIHLPANPYPQPQSAGLVPSSEWKKNLREGINKWIRK